MADYLCPNNMFSIEEQRETFQIQSQTNTLPANRGDPQQCLTGCGRILDNHHIVQCPAINTHIGDYTLILNESQIVISSDMLLSRLHCIWYGEHGREFEQPRPWPRPGLSGGNWLVLPHSRGDEHGREFEQP